MKLYILLAVAYLMGLNIGHTADLEVQRKYLFKTIDEKTKSFLNNGGEIGKLVSHKHSDYIYYDIYIDTPDLALYKNKLSLRFRKRYMGQGRITYGVQLKSEMSDEKTVRMEIEEKELKIYKVYENGVFTPLKDKLDIIFKLAENDGVYDKVQVKAAIKSLESWIKFKSSAAIAPFMKLKRHYKKININHFTVALVGKSKRKRSHIYSIKNDSEELPFKNIEMNKIKIKKVPEYFKTNKSFNWLMESSFDQAVFYPVFDTTHSNIAITEYEVENKYFLSKSGTRVMDIFETSLKEKFSILKGKDSKYRTSIKFFYF